MKLIGICGSSASGKTTLTFALKERFDCSVISQDNYYKVFDNLTPAQLKSFDFANPNTYDIELLVKDLKKIKQGCDIVSPNYSFITSKREGKGVPVKSNNIVIIEGYALLYFEEIRKLLDYSFFIDASEKTKLKRMIQRDTVSRGCTIKDVLNKYNYSVKPNYEKYIKGLNKYADEVLDGETDINLLVNNVGEKINNLFYKELSHDSM